MPQPKPRITFRVDSGRKIGSGHVMRCLSIADSLRQQGARCHFICRAHDGHLGKHIEQSGYDVSLLPIDPAYADRTDYDGWRGGSPADENTLCAQVLKASAPTDILIIDHYGLDSGFETAMRPLVGAIVALDDLHDKPHDCDLLIDQNILHDDALFRQHVTDKTRLMVGADYAPLRDNFAKLRPQSLSRRKALAKPQNLLVALGGYDSLNVTSHIVKALSQPRQFALEWVTKTRIVLSAMAPHLEDIRKACAHNPGIELLVNTSEMPRLMAEADIAIGGSGVSQIERCVMGLPTLIVIMAENQIDSARRLADAGATITLGAGEDITAGQVATALNTIHNSPTKFHDMIDASARLCDGRGLSRIVPAILALGDAPVTNLSS